MGCDGGTIPTRDELVKLKKKPEQVLFGSLANRYSSQKHRSGDLGRSRRRITSALGLLRFNATRIEVSDSRLRTGKVRSSRKREKNVVATTPPHRLYNKESVIKHLLNKGGAQSDFASHIRNLKDVCELKLTKNSSYDRSCLGKADTYVDTQAAEYMCPISGLEMNGRHKCVGLELIINLM